MRALQSRYTVHGGLLLLGVIAGYLLHWAWCPAFMN